MILCFLDQTKMAFYKAAVRPILSYGFPIWVGISHQMELLRKAKRRFIRWTRSDAGKVPGRYKYIYSKWLYCDAGIGRLDAWLIGIYFTQLEKFGLHRIAWLAVCCQQKALQNAPRGKSMYLQPEGLFHWMHWTYECAGPNFGPAKHFITTGESDTGMWYTLQPSIIYNSEWETSNI